MASQNNTHDAKARLSKRENVTIYRSYLGEPKLFFGFFITLILSRIVGFSFESMVFSTSVFTLFGYPVGFIWFPLELVALVLLGIIVFKVHDERYVVESDAILKIKGLSTIGINTTEIYLDNIRVIKVDQDFYQKIFGIGDLKVCTTHSEVTDICMRGIANPFQRKALIERRMKNHDLSGDNEGLEQGL